MIPHGNGACCFDFGLAYPKARANHAKMEWQATSFWGKCGQQSERAMTEQSGAWVAGGP